MRGGAAAIVSLVLLPACGPTSGEQARPQPKLTGTLTVLAAASLSDAFTTIGKRFEAANPGVKVSFSYGGSSTLAAQLLQGAGADVFASADQPSMDRVVRGGLVSGRARVFAHNRLAMAVAPGNPRHLASLQDLARPGLIVVLCQPQVPCGRYAAQALQRAGVQVHAASEELDVKAVLSRVALGEADAGIVYASDVPGSGATAGAVDIPAGQNVVADYPVAALAAGQRDLAQAFIHFLLSAEAQHVFSELRFGAP